MKVSPHILLTALAAILLAAAQSLQANPGFIRPGKPTVYPGADLIRPLEYSLIPTTTPVIHPGRPTVIRWTDLIRSMDSPLIPSTGLPESVSAIE